MIINGFKNLLDSVEFTHSDIEKQIAGYKLVFDQTRKWKVEWGTKLPLFVPPFYEYVRSKGIVPTQNDYWLFYVSENKDYLTNLGLSKDEKIGVRARVFRTYPSLVRDLHFGLYLKSSNLFDAVFYNEVLDIEYGIDLVVEFGGKRVGLNLFTKTKAAERARAVKEYRHKKKVNFPCYEIPVNFCGSKICGDFFLYSDRECATIIDKIRKYAEIS